LEQTEKRTCSQFFNPKQPLDKEVKEMAAFSGQVKMLQLINISKS